MKHHADVSVVIPAWNGERFLDNCLASLRRHTHRPYEVIVIDNGSQDRTAEIAEGYAEVRLVRNSVNLGFAPAVNQGLRLAQGGITLLLNQDTVVLSDWLAPTEERMGTDSQVGIVGYKLLYPDGRVQHAGARLIEPTWNSEHLTSADREEEIDFVTGAAMAIRQPCLEAVGEFDEGFAPAYSEDVDYCLRAQAMGWRVVYEPRVEFTHFESQSRGDEVDFLVNVNAQRLRLVLKHHDAEWIRDVFFPAECEEVEQNLSRDWLLAMAHAYLRAACSVGEIVRWRTEFYHGEGGLAATKMLTTALFELRATALTRARELLSKR